jgi:hypothetical protein
MLDDFREQASASPFFEEDEENTATEQPQQPQRLFLGMTAGQRLVIAMLLLAITCLLSTFCLLVTEKVVLPF